MLFAAIVCTFVYGYIVLFELTANPADWLQYVMDLAGRIGMVAWVVFANAALRDRAVKRARAQEIVEAMGSTDEQGGFRLVR
jgi:L-asparagine transporter-like permease